MSKSGSSKKETKNAEADTKSEADIKGNSSYSSTSTSKTPYCSLQDPERSPDYFKALTEKTEINSTEKQKLLEQQYHTVKTIILSDAQDEYENKQPFEFPKEIPGLETKPNKTFNLYTNITMKQRYTASKLSNTKDTHNRSYPNSGKQRDTVFKSVNLKETNNPYSANVIEKQRDTVLKQSNPKQIHNPTF